MDRVKVEAWLSVGAAAVAFLLLFGETLAKLLRDWANSGEYGHGFFLLPIAAYLAWRNRGTESTPSRWLGLLLLAAAVGLFLVGTLAAEFFTRRVAVLLALAGLTVFFVGIRQLRAWWLPYLLLLFTIPLPEVVLNSLTLPLQLLASRWAVSMLEFRHVPVGLAGNIIFLPGQELFVAEACSGLRSLSALLGLTLLIGGTSLAHPASRIALMALAVPAALTANALRVFATGFASYYIGPRATESTLHSLAGGVVFLVALALVGAAVLALRNIEGRTVVHTP
jgi:exosortase